MVFFSLSVLTKVTVNSSKVVVTCSYLTMVFTINLFSIILRDFSWYSLARLY